MPHVVRGDLEAEGLSLREGIHAASHALLNIMPLYVDHLKLCSSSFQPFPVSPSFWYHNYLLHHSSALDYGLLFSLVLSFSLI